MPKATVNVGTVRKNLKTCPGGYVELRRMTFGQKLERQQMAIDQAMTAQQTNGGRDGELQVAIKMAQRRVAEFEFQCCVVSHNLEDESDQLLNFQNPATIDVLDPRIGEEIQTYISELNNYEDDEMADQKGNFTTASSTPSL